jgi:Spy/CpxP family protein refolding chaperone
MNRTPIALQIRLLMFSALLLAVLLWPMSRAFADPGSANDMPHQMTPVPRDKQDDMDGSPDDVSRHLRMADELKLTDSQRSAFKNAMKQMFGIMLDVHELHQQVHEMVQSDQYDEKKLAELVHKQQAEMEKNIVASASAMHAFYQSLTPEQKSKFNEMRSDMRDHMKDRWEHHRPHGDHDRCEGEDGEK